jgi:PAT family beta-lactamase induction signal transducer AmpG
LKGFSGAVVEQLSAAVGLLKAYALFFVGAGAIGIPALILFALLIRAHNRKLPVPSG